MDEFEHRYPGISPRALQHPSDQAATAALGAIPLVERLFKRLSEMRIERSFEQLLLADAVRLSPQQLGEVHERHEAAYRSLDLEVVPDLYLTRLGGSVASTVGAARPKVLIDPLLVRATPATQHVVLAHEAGHVLFDHVHYATLLAILQRLLATGLAPVASLPLEALTLVLLEWQRCAELSSDRAASLVVGDPVLTCTALLEMTGGQVPGLDVNAFIAQAQGFEEEEDLLARPARALTELRRSHPFAVRRVAELSRWVAGGEFDRLRSGSYLRRGEEPPPSAALAAATEHYRQRFGEILERVAGGVQRIADQIGTWLRG